MSERIKIIAVDIKTFESKIYESVHSAKNDGFSLSCMYACLNGEAVKGQGYSWYYHEDGVDFPALTKKRLAEIVQKRKQRSETILIERECSTCEIIKPITDFHKCETRYGKASTTCKPCRKLQTKRDYQKRKDKIRANTSEYYRNNKERMSAAKLKRQKERLKTDPLYLLTRRLRCRLRDACLLKEWKKHSHFRDYIGCTLPELKAHIESKFIEGMSWDNHGEWHLDHKIPLSSAKTPEALYKLCHYTNIQPLWAKINLSKGAKLPEEMQQL